MVGELDVELAKKEEQLAEKDGELGERMSKFERLIDDRQKRIQKVTTCR